MDFFSTHTLKTSLISAPPFKRKDQPFFQPKLTVNQPGDAYEREADSVADQVMHMKSGDAPIVQRMPLTPVSSIQRACANCEKEKEGVQRKETGGGDASGKTAPSIVSDVLSSGGGQPMDGGTRQFMESRFGQDFSRVRIHTDSRAAESASAIQARAYTSGRDVVFGSGEYQPSSESGQRLLAHELVHVGQQNSNLDRKMVMRKVSFNLGTPQNTINPAEYLEIKNNMLGTKLGSTNLFLNGSANTFYLPKVEFDPKADVCSFTEPSNAISCKIDVPIKNVWTAQKDRTWAVSRIAGAKEYFEKNKCSGSQINIIVQTADRDKKIMETTTHEKKHATDMQDAFKSIVEPYDSALNQRIAKFVPANYDTIQKCTGLKNSEHSLLKSMITKLEVEIASKAQTYHRTSTGQHHVPLTPKSQDCQNVVFKLV